MILFPFKCLKFITFSQIFVDQYKMIKKIELFDIPWKQTRVLWCLTNSFDPGYSSADGLMRRPSTWSPVSRALQNSFISLPQTLQRGIYCIKFPAIRCPFLLWHCVSGHWKTALRLHIVKIRLLTYRGKQCFALFSCRSKIYYTYFSTS